MDVLLVIAAALIAAVGMTWAIFQLVGGVDRWPGPRLALVWLGGAVIIVLFAVGASHVPMDREMITSACDPAHDTTCQPTGAPRIASSGETLCCYPGIKEEPLEHKSALGESIKIALITGLVGIMFGLVILTRTWLAGRR